MYNVLMEQIVKLIKDQLIRENTINIINTTNYFRFVQDILKKLLAIRVSFVRRRLICSKRIVIGACTMTNEYRNVSDVITIRLIPVPDIPQPTTSYRVLRHYDAGISRARLDPLGDLHSTRMPPTTYDEAGSFSGREMNEIVACYDTHETSRHEFQSSSFLHVPEYNYGIRFRFNSNIIVVSF